MGTENIRNIGIVGAGTIGASWATFFATKGFKVKMFDVSETILTEAHRKAKENLDALVGYGLIEQTDSDKFKENISQVKDLGGLTDGVEYIQESTLESYDVKKPLYAELDELTDPSVILASSSSGLLMTQIQQAAKHPERCLIAHPFNPPHLIPLVELVPGEQTAPAIVDDVKVFFEKLDKVPVVLKKEAQGHIANRLAAALWREAIDIVLKGVATVEDVDKALYAGPGIRWALMGQHLIYHLGGGTGGYGYFIDHIGKAFGSYWKEMATWSEISDESRDMLVKGVEESIGDRTIEELSKWRDSKIVDLLKVIYE